MLSGFGNQTPAQYSGELRSGFGIIGRGNRISEEEMKRIRNYYLLTNLLKILQNLANAYSQKLGLINIH